MIYHTIWVSVYGLKCLKTVRSWLLTSAHYSRLLSLGYKWKVAQILCILTTAAYFMDLKLISKTVYCIACSVVCKIVFSSKFSDIQDNAGRVTRIWKEEEHRQLQSKLHFTQTQLIIDLMSLQHRHLHLFFQAK